MRDCHIKGRFILRRLLPAFILFLVICNGDVFADSPNSLESSCIQVNPIDFHMMACLGEWDSHKGWVWMDLPSPGNFIYKPGVIPGAYWIPSPIIGSPFPKRLLRPNLPNYPTTSVVHYWDRYLAGSNYFGGAYPIPSNYYSGNTLKWPTATNVVVWVGSCFYSSVGVLNYSIYYFAFHFDCSQCKFDLANARTTIISEGETLFTAYKDSTGSLPCDSLICLSKYSSYFAYIANSVPVLGFFVSTMIVFRRKRPQRQTQRK